MTHTHDSNLVIKWMKAISDNMPHIKNIVIDDNTFLTSMELLRRAKESTWDKFTDVAQNLITIASTSKNLREDIIVYVMHHTQSEGDGLLEDKHLRAMSYGKLIDEKMGTLEAQFTIVLRAAKEKQDNHINYMFYTRDANSTAKTPIGMFEEETIPNDLALVREKIECYYNGNCD